MYQSCFLTQKLFDFLGVFWDFSVKRAVKCKNPGKNQFFFQFPLKDSDDEEAQRWESEAETQ